ncbi:MAG: glycosyl transferase family protein [Methylomonas sp.]|nr:glycosyl transferase family protein [Methylomonas sp.]PPD21308.1 MAG: glycosyl transferase [Methylomonas sp.]PPD24677.1 MAG: glycosyl transferase [Methylomonas sp.]PPD33226.1 MAG: glycosyl transferase [Methylomonas sp.]PPD41686.1 MAG: glycosyl transferase [Methylomonas sp.]
MTLFPRSPAFQEHPFAEFIKILGKGKKGARPMTQDEAYRAMRMILAGDVLPIQLGAFLMLMRIKEETSEELAGFVQAVREHLGFSTTLTVDLDWSSYAGKRRQLPWFVLSTFLLADNGVTVFMHGAGGHTEGRLYTENVLQAIGVPPAHSLQEAERQLAASRFSYLSLEHICPALFDMINLRPVMGLRSPVHTLVRLVNPFGASHSIQGIFHPSYRQVHQQAALLLGERNMAVLKGEGGETERNPDVDCLVQSVTHGELSDETWPALFERRHMKAESLSPDFLKQVWRGERSDEYGEAAVIATTAVALKLLGRADSQQAAQSLAQSYWDNRQRERLGLLPVDG